MKKKQENSKEYSAFSGMLDKLLQVKHSDIKDKLDAEKKKKPAKRRASSSGRASSDKD